MRAALLRIGSIFCLAGSLLVQSFAQTNSTPVTTSSPSAASLYNLQTHTLAGAPQGLDAYRGKVALVVNLASKCGFTPQYTALEALYEKYKDKGFVILGFPSNDFGGQEPGTPEEIQTFCSTKYSVTFPLFEKVVTKPGDAQSPVYAFLTAHQPPPKWNFTKYLIDKNGNVVASFPSKIKPDDADLIAEIESELAK